MFYQGGALIFISSHGFIAALLFKSSEMILLTILIINALMWVKEIAIWKDYKQF